MTKLLPCPFCGFVPDREEDDCVYPINRERTVWNLVCYETGGGCGASVLGDSAEDVIKRWNTRKGSKPEKTQMLDGVSLVMQKALKHAQHELQNYKNEDLIDTLRTNGFIEN